MIYTRVYAMETTNKCNASCDYCPHDKMTRAQGFVSLDTVRKVIEYMQGIDQQYVALHHMGEPLLHPVIGAIVGLFRLAGIRTEMSTNGLLLPEKGRSVLDEGISLIRIAVDNFYNKAGYIDGVKEFLEMAQDYPDTEVRIHTIVGNDLSVFEGYDAILENKTLDNWAGAIDGESQLDKSNECYFTTENYVVVLWDGTVVPCCMDYNGDYALGNVDDLTSLDSKACKLCKGCANMQFASGGEWLTDEEEMLMLVEEIMEEDD